MPRLHIADGAAQERAKYAEIWSRIPEYRRHSPGLENVGRFMSVLRPAPGSSVIDIGCGEGVAGRALAERGLQAWWLDLTDEGLAPDIPRVLFIEAPLWANWPAFNHGPWDFGFCCDVLEHIPPEFTMLCIDRIARNCRTAWLQIALRPDEFGAAIGEPLHLTVQPFQWWLVRIAEVAEVIDARDLCGDGLYIIRGRE